MSGGVAAGAAAGTQIMPGWGTAIGAVAGGLMDMASTPSAAGPSSADSIFGTSLSFDNGGWNVAFDGSKIDAPTDKTTSQGGAMPPADPMTAYLPYLLGAFAMVVAWKLLKKP